MTFEEWLDSNFDFEATPMDDDTLALLEQAWTAAQGGQDPMTFGDWLQDRYSGSEREETTVVQHMQAAWNAATKHALANRDRILTCVYCGHQYPQGTPPASAEVLTEHIKTCPEHPMAKLQEKLDAKGDPRDHDPRCRRLCGPEPSKLVYEHPLAMLQAQYDHHVKTLEERIDTLQSTFHETHIALDYARQDLKKLRRLFDQLLAAARNHLEASRHDNPDEAAAEQFADATEARIAEIEHKAGGLGHADQEAADSGSDQQA